MKPLYYILICCLLGLGCKKEMPNHSGVYTTIGTITDNNGNVFEFTSKIDIYHDGDTIIFGNNSYLHMYMTGKYTYEYHEFDTVVGRSEDAVIVFSSNEFDFENNELNSNNFISIKTEAHGYK